MTKHDRATDIIDLVCFNKETNFLDGLKFISDIVGIDYYHDFDADMPDSLVLIQLIMDMKETNEDEEEITHLKPIDSCILTYYRPYVNDLFLKDHISYETQLEFGIGYDDTTNYITIPIYSELGDLVGVKGRIFKEHLDSFDIKYVYLEPCAKSKILYGLNKTIDFILQAGFVFVVESEKAVMQLWTYGYMNCVATGGKNVSQTQADLLTRLGVEIVFAFDQDVDMKYLKKISNLFVDNIPIYALFDEEQNILREKESPSDNLESFQNLLNHKLKIK